MHAFFSFQDGRLIEKAYGKQKVYLVQQADLPVATPAEIAAMEQEVKKLENELKEREAVYQASQRELKLLLTTLTTEELKKEIDIVSLSAIIINYHLGNHSRSNGLNTYVILSSYLISTQTAKQVEEMKTQLNAFDTSKPLDPVECKQVRAAREKSLKEWRTLKRLCMEMINTIMESYPGGKKELMEEMGIETDEEAGVAMIN